jgi:hypothetical protein
VDVDPPYSKMGYLDLIPIGQNPNEPFHSNEKAD